MKDRQGNLTKDSYDKHHEKSRHAAPGNLSDPGWAGSAYPHHRVPPYCNGNFGARCRHFDSDRQIIASPGFTCRPSWLPACGLRDYSTPTAREINRMTMLSEIQICTMERSLTQRARSGASVGPKVELWVNAINR